MQNILNKKVLTSFENYIYILEELVFQTIRSKNELLNISRNT